MKQEKFFNNMYVNTFSHYICELINLEKWEVPPINEVNRKLERMEKLSMGFRE